MNDPRQALLSKQSSRKGRHQRLCLALLDEKNANGEIPTNGRFVFYELEMRGKAQKSRLGQSRRSKGSERPREQDLIDALMWLRVKEAIPWRWIEDETRHVAGYDHPDTIADALRQEAKTATINPWDGPAPLLICESRSLSGVLRTVGDEYRCLTTATNGQAGGFLHTDIAPLLADGRPVLYLGDRDHQGAHIEDNTRRVLERKLGYRLNWTRIAITAEQVAERGLTPAVKRDVRYGKKGEAREYEAWEAEALGQATVVALVREALDALLPKPLATVHRREKRQRAAELRRLSEQ